MKNFRYMYLLFGVGFLGFAIILFFTLIDTNVISNFIEDGPSKSAESKYQWIMQLFDLAYFLALFAILVVAAGGIYFLILFVRSFITDIRNNKIKQFGRNGTGTYLKHKEVLKEIVGDNKIPYYEIHFSFKNDSEKIIETKTSGDVFSMCEAEALAVMKIFPIRYMDDNAVIMTDDISSKKK